MRDGWTFHAKGLWAVLPGHGAPSLTMIGSPNFGHRSVRRDIEAQVALVTKDARLQKHLADESERLFADAAPVTSEDLVTPERRGPAYIGLLTRFIRNFF